MRLGGKASTLSPSSLFEVANRLSDFTIDSSSLSRATQSSDSASATKFCFSIPDYLTDEEARASLFLLLNKLLQSSSPPESFTQLANILRGDSPLPSREFEITVLSNDVDYSVAVRDGISALLDYRSSCLATVADAVAALSCEAMKAGVSSFNIMDSGDGSTLKDEVSVAADFRVFFNDSKLVNPKKDNCAVCDIPSVHGHLREVCRSLHASTRVGLSSGFKLEAKAMSNHILSLALAVFGLVEGSFGRVKLILDSMQSVQFRSILGDQCPNSLQNLEEVMAFIQNSYRRKDYMQLFHQVFSLVDDVSKIFSWEATVAFVSLEGDSLIQNIRNDVPTHGDKKGEKKKKVLGKGSAALMAFIKESLISGDGDFPGDVDPLLAKCSENIYSLLDPKQFRFEGFQKKVKEIVESNESRRRPKIAKGTRDFAKEQMVIRERAFAIIVEVFKRHGATSLDTPVFELRETLMGKYGEDSKLIYDLADQGGELCSLRYDLTVPLARYVAMNGLTSFKRYQIAKVYRRDNPSKGRYREFYQCDFDIAGQFEKMGPDFEVLVVLTELLDELNIGEYEVKLNHRKLLDGMMAICGVPPEKFRTICSSIDKLDKQSFENIKKEMVNEKGLSNETAEAIGSFVKQRGSPMQLLRELQKEGSRFKDNPDAKAALEDLETLFKALEKTDSIEKVVFDLSLARGLDYYTGLIFEAVFKGSTQVGSIAAGGRYDNLIGMFGTKPVPAVGISLGIERVFVIMEQLESNQAIRATETDVLVSVLGDDLSVGAELVNQLWKAKVKAEYMVHKRQTKHNERAIESGIPWRVIVGDKEIEAGTVKIKDANTKEEWEVPRNSFVEEVCKRLNGVRS